MVGWLIFMISMNLLFSEEIFITSCPCLRFRQSLVEGFVLCFEFPSVIFDLVLVRGGGGR